MNDMELLFLDFLVSLRSLLLLVQFDRPSHAFLEPIHSPHSLLKNLQDYDNRLNNSPSF